MPPYEKSCSCPMAGEDSRQLQWASLFAIVGSGIPRPDKSRLALAKSEGLLG